MDLAIKNENLLVDVSKVKTGKTNYDNRNKIFANWCKKNNLSQDLDSLKKYLAREDIGVSTKNNTKIAVKSALKKIHKNNPERLRELEDNFKEL
ncbi:MAG: hypothetical protein KDK36_07615, partial [Leptospiraceae bacterium]|nr:hypothetical protein [Leptospiraceae bacterium]